MNDMKGRLAYLFSQSAQLCLVGLGVGRCGC